MEKKRNDTNKGDDTIGILNVRRRVRTKGAKACVRIIYICSDVCKTTVSTAAFGSWNSIPQISKSMDFAL